MHVTDTLMYVDDDVRNLDHIKEYHYLRRHFSTKKRRSNAFEEELGPLTQHTYL